ncbi:MAG: A/G-specific adenine glycosylase [Pusillimonas sp.]
MPEHTPTPAQPGAFNAADPVTPATFAAAVVNWQKQHGRHHLPWQQSYDAYTIWLSEIMLQQTQVSTVLGYYERFLERFPTLGDLARARQDEVMPYWAGLGYYARARNLHRCAQTVQEHYNGKFPEDPALIAGLPGIGRSTAGAIAAFAWQVRTPIMDGNVKRVFTRWFGIAGYPGSTAIDKKLWELAHSVLDAAPDTLDIRAYTQGLMDLGSGPCARRNPSCGQCPLQNGCHARMHNLQNTLPTPKPRAAIPLRTCHMLVLTHNGKVLLEQRADSGIWGGLLSLPQFDDEDALQRWCTHRGITVQASGKMAGLQHVFSHFKLDITPWRVEVEAPALAEPSPVQHWLALAGTDKLAVPAPVKKILDGLATLPLFAS